MAKFQAEESNDTSAQAVVPDAAVPITDPDLTVALDEWAASKSVSLGRRVESLAAFHTRMQRTGRGRETAGWFDSAFQSFLKEPA